MRRIKTVPHATNPSLELSSSKQSKILVERGARFNDRLLYPYAIPVLTTAIQFSSHHRDAYIERAIAYFENNQLQLALKDYERAKKLTIVVPFRASSRMKMLDSVYVPGNKTEFAKGLVSGTLDGAKVSSVEFIPSIFSCCRGIVHGLWAFACSPKEVCQEMIDATYVMGEFISQHSTAECLQCVVPELRELATIWHQLDDYSRGIKIGYIIGKYGVDIFAPASALKGINKIRALKRANAMCTFESCAISEIKQAKILEESTKRAATRTTFIESAKKGKIFIKNSNTQYHIMQKKHAWERVIPLSGDIEQDFAKVITLLEESNIADKAFLKKPPELFPVKAPYEISKTVYEKIINDYTIHIELETYLETEIVFLKDAWVITK